MLLRAGARSPMIGRAHLARSLLPRRSQEPHDRPRAPRSLAPPAPRLAPPCLLLVLGRPTCSARMVGLMRAAPPARPAPRISTPPSHHDCWWRRAACGRAAAARPRSSAALVERPPACLRPLSVAGGTTCTTYYVRTCGAVQAFF